MTPQELQAWIAIAQQATSIGLSLYGTVHKWITESHPLLTPDQQKAAFDAIGADDLVRANLAAQAAGEK